MFAFGNKHPYHEVVITTPIKSTTPIAIAIHDQRQYIIDASKSATFCGSMRSGVGIPYDITTKSDKPVADDMLGILCSALEKNGNPVIKVLTRSGLSKKAVITLLNETQAEKQIYISIHEWKTDTYMKADLYCFVTLDVYNKNGEIIAENSIKANAEAYGGSFWNPKKAARKGALLAVKLKLDLLLNSEKIVKIFD
ncbi:MAG: hypothetical protein WCQ95_06800 [Bacteroidota bacterium]